MAIQVLKSDIRFKHKTQSGNVQYSTPLDFLIVDQGSTYFETWNSQIQGIVNSINNNLSTVNNFCQGYKANQKYLEGSYIYYNNQLYCCTSTIQKSTNWNNDKRYFQRTTISNQLTELFNNKLDKPANGTVGQVLTKAQYGAVWSDFPNDNIISTAVAQAVANWMSDNLTIPENQSYILDDSLTLTTAAAQAKATGDAINSVVKVSVQQPDDNFNKIWIHDIQTGAKSVFTQEEIQNIIAPAYTIETSYKEGDYVIYNGAIYCITANINAEENTAWNDVSKKQINVCEQVNNLNEQVKIIKKGESFIDFSKYETVACTIYSDNTVLRSDKNFISYQIPIDGYKFISITASPTANAIISFLKEAIPSNISNKTNITNYFATQETGRHVITKNTTDSFFLPDDTKYLFVTKTSSGDDSYIPTSIILKTLIGYKLSNIDISNIVNFYEAVSTIIEDTVTETKIDTTLTHSNEAADAEAVGEQISEIKNAIKAVNNIADITITQSTQYTAFEFEVGKRYILYNGTNNSMNAHTMTAPSTSGTVIEAIGTNIQAGAIVEFEPSTNASYARFYCNGRGTVSLADVSSGVPKLEADVAKLQDESTTYVQKSGKAQVTERNTTFFEQTSNLFNKDNVTDNYDLKQDGSGIYAATGYMATEYYIDVSAYNSIKPLAWSGNAVIAASIRYVLYNENKVALNQRTNTNSTIDTSNASYLRFGASLGAKGMLMVVPGDINPTVYIPYGFTFKYNDSQTVEINPSDDIIQKILDNEGKNIYFNAGTYDIISQYESHFGNDYFTNYTGYTSGGNNLGRGLPIYRGTKVTFSQGAVFTANYTGSNTAVRTNFAAFAIETGVEIDGLRLTTSGIRNCIHDDFDNTVSGETIIKNCSFTSDTNIIAGGLGIHDILIIKNCYFDRTNDTYEFDFSYHNNSTAGAQSVVIIKDNYMRHGVSIRWYGASTLLTDVFIFNNNMAYDVDFHAENASATIENINLKSWNNLIRTIDGKELETLQNAFDKSLYGLVDVKFVTNKYVNPSTGAYITSTGAKATEYVSCLPDEVILIDVPVSSSYGAWYNSNKERIASLSLNSGEGYIKAPSNAYYFATSTLNDDIDGIQIYTNIGVRLKELTNTVNSFGETKAYSVGQKDVKSLNLFDASLVTEGYYLNGSSGTPVQNARYGYTDYIPLSGDKYEYPSALQNTSIYFYDANKALLAPAARAMKNYDMASTWPVGTKYCRFNVTVATMDSIVFQTSVNTGYYISSSQVVDNVYNIQVGSTRDYKTIKSAIDYINHIADEDATYNILLDSGTYNALDGFDLSQQDSTFSGIILPNNTYIIGQGNADDVVIVVDGTNFPSNISNNEVSTLNMYRNNGLKNVTIKSKNIRYGLHDDDAYRATNPVNGAVQVFENVKFINEPHTVSGVASYCVGIGMKRGETLKFIRCEFENQDTTYCAIGFHNGTTGLVPTTYEFDSCKVAANGTYGFRLTTTAYNVVDRVIFKGCKSNKNLLLDKASNYTDTKTSFKIFGYGNVGITVSTSGIELNTEDTEMLIS